MALSATQMATTLAGLLANAPVTTTFTYSGTSYTGVKTNLAREKAWTIAGYADEYKFSLVCRASLFATDPTVQGKVAIGETNYRIIGVERDAVDLTIRIDLSGEYQ